MASAPHPPDQPGDLYLPARDIIPPPAPQAN
jgi:hypothetical protein